VSRTRGAANRSLYRARILLESWSREEEGGRVPSQQLLGAFLPAVRAHLLEAYGWFLLAVSGRDDAPRASLPTVVADLPAPEPGRELPPELREFALLERDGWLAELLDDALAASADEPGAAPGSAVLGSDRPRLSLAAARVWLRELTATMQRMDDSLAEC
jgi:hypothetical protein